jgi:hypothetical protein
MESVRESRKYGVNDLMSFLADVWSNGSIQVPVWGKEFWPRYLKEPETCGIVLAALRWRSNPEFVHSYQKEKIPGRRRVLTTADRADRSTSARYHIWPLHEHEWNLLDYCFLHPRESENSKIGMGFRVFGEETRDFLVDGLGYITDDHNEAFPQNEDNPKFIANLEILARKIDNLLAENGGEPSVLDSYCRASRNAFEGFIDKPQGMEIEDYVGLSNAVSQYETIYFSTNWTKVGGGFTCKIGRSGDPKKRMKGLGTSVPFKFYRIFELYGPGGLEKLIHRKLSYARICGDAGTEHFKLKEVQEFIEEVIHSDGFLCRYLKKV